MRSPLSWIWCSAAICAAILGYPYAVIVLLLFAFGTELLAVPRLPR